MTTIVVEALSALRGGGRTYLKNLFANYPEHLEDIRIIAIVPSRDQGSLTADDRVCFLSSRFASLALPTRLLWLAFVFPSLLKKLAADIVYCPGGSLTCRPDGPYRTAVAFRNMLPFSEDQVRKFRFGWMRLRLAILRRVQLRSLAEANLVIFISNHAKGAIARLADLKGRSEVIPHGLAEHFRRRQPLPEAPFRGEYVLYVSILNVYKAQLEVVEAWNILRQRRTTIEVLLLVGPEYGPYADSVRARIAELHLERDVILLGAVPYDRLPAYYQHAKVNLFASECENCPNILLEALAAGRPVAASAAEPMPEFAGDAALYFDPRQPEQIADALCSLLDDSALAEEMAGRALERSKLYEWRDAARRTWDALYSLARV